MEKPNRKKERCNCRGFYSAFFVFFGFIGIFLWHFGTLFLGPFPNLNQPIPPGLPVEVLSFRDEAGTFLKGWLIKGQPGKGVVVVLHGHGGNKSMSLGRVRFLHDAGYSVFVFDFQGHGESQLKSVTLGYEEARNVRAALALLKSRLPKEKIALIGPSLGGAALLVKGQVIPADAYIFEGVYYSLERTGEHRLAEITGQGIAHWLAPLLAAQVRLRLGFSADALEPIATVSELKAPVLIIGGTKDPYVTEEETKVLYEKAPEPKELWLVEGGGHLDFFLFGPSEYKRRVLAFLETHFK
ncbi:MAG: alpha/beta hydrolase [Alphaproteobacteria bacterium]|nr:alpha/beta hydrolase [Alphaproteobacteria bacterium]